MQYPGTISIGTYLGRDAQISMPFHIEDSLQNRNTIEIHI